MRARIRFRPLSSHAPNFCRKSFKTWWRKSPQYKSSLTTAFLAWLKSSTPTKAPLLLTSPYIIKLDDFQFHFNYISFILPFVSPWTSRIAGLWTRIKCLCVSVKLPSKPSSLGMWTSDMQFCVLTFRASRCSKRLENLGYDQQDIKRAWPHISWVIKEGGVRKLTLKGQ